MSKMSGKVRDTSREQHDAWRNNLTHQGTKRREEEVKSTEHSEDIASVLFEMYIEDLDEENYVQKERSRLVKENVTIIVKLIGIQDSEASSILIER